MQSRLSLTLKTPRETKQNSRASLYGSVMFNEIFLNLRQTQTDYKMEACFCGIQIEARSKFHINFRAAKLPLVIECCNASNHPPRHHLYQILDPEPNEYHISLKAYKNFTILRKIIKKVRTKFVFKVPPGMSEPRSPRGILMESSRMPMN